MVGRRWRQWLEAELLGCRDLLGDAVPLGVLHDLLARRIVRDEHRRAVGTLLPVAAARLGLLVVILRLV